MAFKFRLEKILKLKTIDENRSIERLSSSRRERDHCSEMIRHMEAGKKVLMEMLQGEKDQPLSVEEYAMVTRQLEALEHSLSDLRKRSNELETMVQQRSIDAQSKSAERRAYEDLKDRARKRFLKESGKREQAAHDETASRIFFALNTLETCDE